MQQLEVCDEDDDHMHVRLLVLNSWASAAFRNDENGMIKKNPLYKNISE